jgi:hypothetical protein
MIPVIDAGNFPPEVLEWCLDYDYSTHYNNDVARIDLEEESPMLTWLTEKGFRFTAEDYVRGWGHVAILGT